MGKRINSMKQYNNENMKLFNKILIANRGEIAVRIIRSAQKLGIKTVAVYSEVDENTPHVRMADESYCIGEVELSDTYLNIDKIIEVAKKSQAEAIHPGYGFLAENPSFVKACEDAGIVFIGPNSKAIQLMGNKIEARAFVKKTGVPFIEGITGDTETLIRESKNIAFPVLIKAAAGGGGKGMRIVYDEKELKDAIEATSREAKSYFSDGTVFIEKFIEEPRHIEIQVIGDNFGNAVHLFERECSIQRRYQKIIEESPSPTINEEVRKQMGEAAVKITKDIGYNNAGTIEFLVDKDLNFFFLEMNTRVQVEHPVTEMVTGVDIVEEQILVAAGNELRIRQEELSQKGHAIECRIYAEDPSNNFLPSPGKMTLYSEPEGSGIRIDSGITEAATIHSFFDPMISKLIVWAETRENATAKMIKALKDYHMHGITTNISYLIKLMQQDAYINNTISTKFCDDHTDKIVEEINSDKENIDPKIPVTAFLLYTLNKNYNVSGEDVPETEDIWNKIGYWRDPMCLKIKFNDEECEVNINSIKNNNYEFEFREDQYASVLKNICCCGGVDYTINDTFYSACVSEDSKYNGFVSYEGHIFEIKRLDILSGDFSASDFETYGDEGNVLTSPMPGKVIKINVKDGDSVKKGDVVLVVEAMKMENSIVANKDAVVKKVNVNLNRMVEGSTALVVFEEEE